MKMGKFIPGYLSSYLVSTRGILSKRSVDRALSCGYTSQCE
jgi:hypothetical protein